VVCCQHELITEIVWQILLSVIYHTACQMAAFCNWSYKNKTVRVCCQQSAGSLFRHMMNKH